jgi:BASS family bile acid:Na+ symporter
MKPGFQRTLPILTAMVLGALLPQAHAVSWVVRWLVIWMLFLVFLQARISRDVLHRSHFVLLAANFATGLGAWGIVRLLGGGDLALAAFFSGITPTAIAAPVITSFLNGRVSYVAGAFLLSNLAVAASLPILLPWVLGRPTPEAFAQVTGSMGMLVFTPFVLAWLLRRIHPPAAAWPRRLGNVSFGVWVTAIFLITANASHFLRSQSGLSRTVVFEIATISLIICAFSFALGRIIGGREFGREASQSLGQKNTTFTIYLAMTYANPLVALGPTFYVVWHNLWNSWQLHQHANEEARKSQVPEAEGLKSRLDSRPNPP